MTKISRAKKAFITVSIVFAVIAALGVFAVIEIAAFDSAANAYNKQNHVVDVNHCITDAAKLKETFPSLGDVISCRWGYGIMRKDTFFESLLDIGPSQYWMNGYAILDPKDVERLLKDYSWQTDTDNLIGHFTEIARQIEADKELDWKQSDDFNVSFGGFHGNFYLDPNNRIMLFDLIQD